MDWSLETERTAAFDVHSLQSRCSVSGQIAPEKRSIGISRENGGFLTFKADLRSSAFRPLETVAAALQRSALWH